MAEGTASRSLEFTPTWTVATVCAIFVVVGITVLYGIEKIEKFLRRKRRRPLVQALEKMKEELMLLGFISLMLTVFQYYVASICLKTSILDHWTPCDLHNMKTESSYSSEGENRRRLLSLDAWPMNSWSNEPLFQRRILAAGEAKTCKEGYDSFVSTDGLHKLHIFLFVLGVVHLVYSLVAMLLASLRVNGWRIWEDEAEQQNPQNLAEITQNLTLERNRSFIQHHTESRLERHAILVWIVCFFRQFGRSVSHSDYHSLRLGFIASHKIGHRFDFHSYMIRSLEDEYQVVVGISHYLWMLTILFFLFNINGTNLYFWLSIVPPVLIVLVGAKLQHIIASLALEQAGITHGGHLAGDTLKLRDDLFWLRKPQLVLHLIHFILFQNAFEMATFIWFLWQFGYDSCFMDNKIFLCIRIGLGAVAQIICSYNTLPVYAIVSQMGTHYKHAIFQHHVKDKLQRWRKDAKRRVKHGSTTGSVDGSVTSTPHRHPGGVSEGSTYGFGTSDDDSSRGNRTPLEYDSTTSPSNYTRFDSGVPISPTPLLPSAAPISNQRPTPPFKRPTSPLRPTDETNSPPPEIITGGSGLEPRRFSIDSESPTEDAAQPHGSGKKPTSPKMNPLKEIITSRSQNPRVGNVHNVPKTAMPYLIYSPKHGPLSPHEDFPGICNPQSGPLAPHEGFPGMFNQVVTIHPRYAQQKSRRQTQP